MNKSRKREPILMDGPLIETGVKPGIAEELEPSGDKNETTPRGFNQTPEAGHTEIVGWDGAETAFQMVNMVGQGWFLISQELMDFTARRLDAEFDATRMLLDSDGDWLARLRRQNESGVARAEELVKEAGVIADIWIQTSRHFWTERTNSHLA